MRIIAIGNQKGGTGKSTSTAAIGHLLSTQGKRVLLLDLDPQSSLTQALGIDVQGATIAEVIGGATPGTNKIGDVIVKIDERLDLVPADIALANSELGLIQRIAKETVLKRALEAVSNAYDVCLIDCAPSLSTLTINALTAAEGVIIPVLPSALDLRGMTLFISTIEQVKQATNPGLEVIGVLINQFATNINAHTQALDSIKASGWRVLGVIPRTVRAQESAAFARSLPDYDPTGKATLAYTETTNEVIKWLDHK